MATDLNNLTFGIEIECCIPANAVRENGWSIGNRHAGHPIPGFDGWRAEDDGSIHANLRQHDLRFKAAVPRKYLSLSERLERDTESEFSLQ